MSSRVTRSAAASPTWERRKVRADRDLFEQLCCIRELTADLPPSLPQRPPERSLFAEQDLQNRLAIVSTLRGDGAAMVRNQLQQAAERGAMRAVNRAPDPRGLGELHRDFPNFEKATSFVQAQLALCRCTQEQLLQLPPLLLAGPPGIGKTFYAAMLARVLGLPITEVQVSTLSADFSLGGLDASYESAKPGVIWNALQSETMSPLVVLDELDKLPSHAGGALGCLYGLLERHSARRFCDQALLLPVDASWISWMATCNDLEAIEPALRSRFHVIEVQPPTAVQRAAMVSSVHRALLCESSWAGAFDQDLSRAVIARLGDLSPRAVRRTLELAYAKAALAGRRRIEPIDVDAVPGLQRRGIGFVQHP